MLQRRLPSSGGRLAIAAARLPRWRPRGLRWTASLATPRSKEGVASAAAAAWSDAAEERQAEEARQAERPRSAKSAVQREATDELEMLVAVSHAITKAPLDECEECEMECQECDPDGGGRDDEVPRHHRRVGRRNVLVLERVEARLGVADRGVRFNWNLKIVWAQNCCRHVLAPRAQIPPK